MSGGIVAVTSLALEARIARGAGVSVICSQGSRLAAALESILQQTEVTLEVIVVDDHSTDRTGTIADAAAAADPRVQVIHQPPLPPGWLGKQSAMHQAAGRASGRVRSTRALRHRQTVQSPKILRDGFASMLRSRLQKPSCTTTPCMRLGTCLA